MTPAPDARAAREHRAAWVVAPSLLLAAFFLPFTAHADDPLVIRDAREISVTATRGERNLLDVPANVTVIDRAAIERSGAPNLPELLRREAGLFVANTTTNAEGYSVEARGFLNGGGNGCRTLVLIDGRRANEPDSGCPDWTFLTLDTIERVEIVRGQGSTAYGDNALGGVIQIFTRSAGAEGETRASLALERASFDGERANGFVSQRFGALRVGASASYDDTAGYRERASLNNKRWQIDLGYELGDAGSLGLAGGYASSERSRPGTLNAGGVAGDPRAAGPNLDFGRERERFLQGSLDLALPWEVQLRATPYYRKSQARNHFDNQNLVFPFVLDSNVASDAGGLDLQLAREVEWFGRELRLLGGVELRQDDIELASASNFGPAQNQARRKLWGVFAQAEAWLIDDVMLSLGLRRDRSDVEGTSSFAPGTRFDVEQAVWSPRAALSWRFHENGSAYISYGRGFRFPNLDEAFGSYGSSPGLSPERAHGVETGATWRGERFEARAVLYTMYVKDEIFFNPTAPNPFFPPPFNLGMNDNVDEVRHQGAELSGRVSLLEWLHASASYTHDDVEVRKDSVGAFVGQQLPITPKNRGSLMLEAELPLGLAASLSGTFVGDRRVANDVLGAEAELADYATLDARVAWTRDLAQGVAFTLEATGRNLTGADYSDFAGVSIFSFPPETRFYPAPDRNWSVGARVSFER